MCVCVCVCVCLPLSPVAHMYPLGLLSCITKHLYDWAWAQKNSEVSIGPYLSKGKDGAIFMLSCTHKTSKTDYSDFHGWYERAAGFDKPFLILSNKNDQKKKAVSDGEALSLAKGKDRAFVPISLADDTGIDESIEALARLLLKDVTLTVSGVKALTLEDAKHYMGDLVAGIIKA